MKKINLTTLKRKLKSLANAENKVTTIKKELAIILTQLGAINWDKKQVRDTITNELQNLGFSEKYIKKVRGYLMAFYEGANKTELNENDIIAKINKTSSDNELEKLGRAVKKGTFELNIKKESKTQKEKSEENEALEIIKKFIKLPKNIKLNEEKINLLLEEVEKIKKLLTE